MRRGILWKQGLEESVDYCFPRSIPLVAHYSFLSLHLKIAPSSGKWGQENR